MIDGDNLTRRDVLKGTATAGVVGLAGCTGDDDAVTLTVGGTSSGSSTQAAGQALARGMSEHGDGSVNISVQETDGWTANMYEFDSGELNTIGVDNNSLSKGINGEDPFDEDPVENIAHQGFIFTSLEMHWVSLDGTGIESTEDLREGGYTIYPIQPGFGTRLLTEEVIREAGLWEQNEILNVDTGDIPGAVEEDRVDALVLYGSNGIELSGWCQEVDVRSDGRLNVMEVDDDFRQTIEDIPGAILTEYEPYGYTQDVDAYTDTAVSWALAGQWAFDPEIPADATYEVCRVASEHWETLQESDPTTLDHSDHESMTDAVIPEHPIHAGVADFFQDNGVWDDSWIHGDEA